MIVKGKIIDIFRKTIFNGEIHIIDGKISSVKPVQEIFDHYILPGFIDAHIHIESSMLVPYEFAKIALLHGTIATVSDPHEIANVCGLDGVHYMIKNGREAGLSFFFGAPSCVPATSFESAGAVINARDVKTLLENKDIWYLSEMMNYPGVLFGDEEVLQKIAAAKECGKPVDGHSPGLKGEDAVKYIKAGISTDHECTTLEEAEWKLQNGMKILIREGSAAKNYAALEPLISSHPDLVMFCSDDKHPDDLIRGHINELVKRSLDKHDLFDVLRIACVNPVLHYNLPVGLLREGDSADFIIVNNLEEWKVTDVYAKGEKVVHKGKVSLPEKSHEAINQFGIGPLTVDDIPSTKHDSSHPVIHAIDGSLVTEKTTIEAVPQQELLQIWVVNRYHKAPVAMAYITGFGRMKGAIASSVAHDSHNIVAVGKNETEILTAVNEIVKSRGGLSFVQGDESLTLALPVAGLMHTGNAYEVGEKYQALDRKAKEAGCTLNAPFMTLSFMALLVIPKIKLSDFGLFDAELFTFIATNKN